VEPGDCERCGGSNPWDALNCQWCGARLPRPLSVALTAEPIPEGYRTLEAPEPLEPPRRISPAVVVGFVLLVIVRLVLLAMVFSNPPSTTSPGTPIPSPSGSVRVTEVQVSSPDDACGLNGADHAGFNATPLGGWTLTWTLPVSGPLPCNVSSVASVTPGFTAISFELPLNVTSQGTPLPVTVFTPEESYSGLLNLTFR